MHAYIIDLLNATNDLDNYAKELQAAAIGRLFLVTKFHQELLHLQTFGIISTSDTVFH